MRYLAELGVEMPLHLRKDFLSKLWYVSDALEAFAFDGDRSDRVCFDLTSPDESVATMVAGRIGDVARRMLAGFRPSERRVLVDRAGRIPLASADPHPGLEASGAVRRFGRGRYGLGPLACRVLDLLGEDLRRLARTLATAPHRFPALIGADTLARCRYLESFPHALTVASHFREDLEAIQAFARSAGVEGGRLALEEGALAPAECLLSPAVCFHVYEWLAGTRLQSMQRVVAEGKCFRYESGALEGLNRLWDFSMLEFVAVGGQDEVIAFRQAGIDGLAALLDEWELAYQIHTATDPFFVDTFAKQAVFQAAFELKYEASVLLPYRGDALAVASFNYHQDFFGRSFAIQDTAGRPAHTACVGVGLERFFLGFTAQHGTEPAGWPPRIRARLERETP